jgi:spore coat protein U-like protein
MKALRFVTLALAMMVAGCNDSNPTPPTDNNPPPQNTTTQTTTFNLNLKPGNERPAAVTNSEASATGTAVIKINITRDAAFNIVSANAEFDVQVAGFPAGSAVNIAHIHPGDLNSTGSILVNTGLVAGEVQLSNGAGSFRKTVSADGSVLQGVVNNPAGFYFNVHSTANPGGVLRAQMDNTGVAASQEPGEPKPGNPGDPYYPTRVR